MSRKHSFVITISNNKTEKEGVAYLLENYLGFFQVTKESRKEILTLLNLDLKYSKAFDVIYIPNLEKIELTSNHLKTYLEDIILVELKTTKKFLPNNPKGFFFGATEKEFEFATILGKKFRFCFVCLNENSKSMSMQTLEDLERLIKLKRVQFQIHGLQSSLGLNC
mgnify:CR=1 FL=1